MPLGSTRGGIEDHDGAIQDHPDRSRKTLAAGGSNFGIGSATDEASVAGQWAVRLLWYVRCRWALPVF
jgi:hypothetical protein